jgi:hypothetical protein
MSNLDEALSYFAIEPLKEYNDFIQKWRRGDIASHKAMAHLCLILQDYLCHISELDENFPDFDISIFYEILQKETRKKIKVNSAKYNIGCFVEALMRFGSSGNQAFLFTAEFLGNSESKVKSAYRAFKMEGVYPAEMPIENFLLINAPRLKDFFIKDKKISGFPRANKAFSELHLEIIKVLSRDGLGLDSKQMSK